MEIILTILLIIVVVVLLNRPKKSRRTYNHTQTDPATASRTKPGATSDRSVGQKAEMSPMTVAGSFPDGDTHIEHAIEHDSSSVHVNISTKTTHISEASNDTKNITEVEAKEVLGHIFGNLEDNSISADIDYANSFEESREKAKRENQKDIQKTVEWKKEQETEGLRRDFDAIIKFIWPDARYEYPYDLTWESAFSNVMFYYDPSKNLYGMYEHLLTDYPKKMTGQQRTWITEAARMLFRGAAYIFYDNDDSILEEYKYLCYPSHLQEILFNNIEEYPKLVAALGAWAVYQGDCGCMTVMFSQYRKLKKGQQKAYTEQLAESLNRPREDVFSHTLEEISTVISTLRNFTDSLDPEEADRKKIRDAILFLKQGYDEKAALEKIKKGKIRENRANRRASVPSVNAKHPLERIEDPDTDREALFRQLSHVRWKYDFLSEKPEDQEYIKRDIRSLTHIDWEDVDHLIDDGDRELASQMRVFREAMAQIRKYRIWNTINKSCPETIEVKYKYPNGKAGDIDRGLALCYGIDQPEQIDALIWKVEIDPRKYFDIIDLIVNGRLGVINDREEAERIQSEPQAQFLIKYNNYAKLRAMTSSVYSGEGITRTNYFSIASSVQSNYYHQLRNVRNLFYQELIVTTGSSSKWKSEQQVYSITKYEFPDAVYQFHTLWLGKQSLDVFIPSLSVGIEYQGLQHYEPVELFGGEEGFKGVVERDKRKRKLCIDNGIRLIYWKYDEPINSELLYEKLAAVKSGEQNQL